MKKLFSIAVTMLMVFSLFSPVAQAKESNLDKVLDDVNKTNKRINEMIYKAVDEAEKETLNYMKQVEILEKGKKVVSLENEIAELRVRLYGLDVNRDDYQDMYNKILKDINEKENKIVEILQKQKEREIKLVSEMEALKGELINTADDSKKNVRIIGIVNEIQGEIEKSDVEIQKLTDKLNEKIDKIIIRLINETNKLAAEMREKAAKKGITVICELVKVEIGGQNIWIDPLRIVGF